MTKRPEIPRCPCGHPVYGHGLCYGHWQEACRLARGGDYVGAAQAILDALHGGGA